MRLDDEALIRFAVVTTRAIQVGEDVTEADFSYVKSVEPADVDANSGWVCFARLPSGEAYVAFDFTYDRERPWLLLNRAEEFMACAKSSRESSLSVCLDSAFSAAELAVQAEMLVVQEETQNHKVRGKWLEGSAELGNAPKEHADTLWLLGDLRKKARYEHEPVRISSERLNQLLDVVGGISSGPVLGWNASWTAATTLPDWWPISRDDCGGGSSADQDGSRTPARGVKPHGIAGRR